MIAQVPGWTIADVARELREELEAAFPETIKVPSKEGGYVRVPTSVNPDWYRRMCRRYMKSRRRYPKLRTFIKRMHTIAALRKIERGHRQGVYVERVLPFIEERLSNLRFTRSISA